MANAEESTKAGLSRLQDDARPTICSDSLELISNIAEVGLDEILQNEFLKDIPVISSLVSIYKIGNNIHNAHLLKSMRVSSMSSTATLLKMAHGTSTSNTLKSQIGSAILSTCLSCSKDTLRRTKRGD